MSTDSSLLILFGMLAVLAHFGLVVVARRWNVLFALAAVYCVLAPLSGAEQFSMVAYAKAGRVYCTVLMCILGLVMLRSHRIRPATLSYGVFVLFYVLSGAYSASWLGALQFKGLYALVVLAGFLMAYSLRDTEELQRNLRLLTIGSLVFGGLLVADLALSRFSFSEAGRLQPWGLNANRLGHEAAAFLVLSAVLALFDASGPWKAVGYMGWALFAVVVLASGSRASVILVILAVGALVLPLIRRPAVLVAALVIPIVAVWIGVDLLRPEAAERFSELSARDRMEIWNYGFAQFSDSPILGQGWLFEKTRRASGSPINFHNIYIQVLAEGGLVGATLFIGAILVMQLRSLQVYVFLRGDGRALTRYGYLPLALLSPLLLHGLAESSLLQGSSVISLLFPFSVGLLDRFRELSANEPGRAPAPT